MEEKRQDIPGYLDYMHISAYNWIKLMTKYTKLEDKHNYSSFSDWLDRSALKEIRERFYANWSDRIKNGNTDCTQRNDSLQESDESK